MQNEASPRTNRYAGTCTACGTKVDAGKGRLRKGDDGKWTVSHAECYPNRRASVPKRSDGRADVVGLTDAEKRALDGRDRFRWGDLVEDSYGNVAVVTIDDGRFVSFVMLTGSDYGRNGSVRVEKARRCEPSAWARKRYSELPTAVPAILLALDRNLPTFDAEAAARRFDAFVDDPADAELDEIPVDEPYCDFCERYGHVFGGCPARDDESLFDEASER